MTCVVGLVHRKRVYLGGDAIAVAGYDMHVRHTPKVFRRGPFVIGCCGSFRMADVLRFHLKLPSKPSGDLHRYMVTVFVEAMREAMKNAGVTTIENNTEQVSGSMLVGVHGRLFTIEDDYQVGEPSGGFTAVGCGAPLALGALYALRAGSPRLRLTRALQAAETYSAGVRGPFSFVTLPAR